MITSLLDAIDEPVDAEFDRIAAAQAIQSEDYKPTYNRLDTFRDVLPSIMERKRPVLTEEKDYNAFLVNHMLSYHDDTLYFANEMNMNHQLDNRLQYDFLFHAVRARRRPWAKWIKPIKADDLAAVKLYFGYSDAKAQTALNILSEADLQIIREQTTIGE